MEAVQVVPQNQPSHYADGKLGRGIVSGEAFGLSSSIKATAPHGLNLLCHPRVPKLDPNHKFSPQFVTDLQRLLNDSDGDIIVSYGGYGVGKTTGIRQYAARVYWPTYEVEGTLETSFQIDLMGRLDPGTGEFIPGPLYCALKDGGIFLLNEADAMNASELVGFYELLTSGMEVAATGEWVEPHKLFRCVFTFNNGGLTSLTGCRGTTKLSDALVDRFIFLESNTLSVEETEMLLKSKLNSKVNEWNQFLNSPLNPTHVNATLALVPQLVKVREDINAACLAAKTGDYQTTNGVPLDKPMSMRSLVRWARELLRTPASSARNRIKKTFNEAYAHRLASDQATHDAVMHLCKSVFGDVWTDEQ